MGNVKVRDLFVETRMIVAEYREKADLLDQQEQELNAELIGLQEEMTANILDQDTATVSEKVYLRIQAKEINQRTEIIKFILDELQEEKTALKLEFVPLYRKALPSVSEYDVTEMVERYRYELLNDVADTGKQILDQYSEIQSDIMELFDDNKVKEQYPNLIYQHGRDSFKPSFSWFSRDVVSKNEIFYACGGSLPEGVTKPKDVK